jgi:hypothetical protein
VQWHPEKNIYEWGIKDNAPFEEISHSREAVRVAQWAANFFVDHVCVSTGRKWHGMFYLKNLARAAHTANEIP